MSQVIIKEVIANHDSDQKELLKAERIMGLTYFSKDDTVFLSINIGADDHSIDLSIDRKQLIEAIGEALINPEE